MLLVLSYFDQIFGPMIYKIVPGDISKVIANKILEFINVNVDDSFIDTILIEEEVKLINIPFSIPSDWSRGKKLDALLTVVINQNYKSEPFQNILMETTQEMKEVDGLYKPFYKKDKDHQSDPDMDNMVILLDKILNKTYDDIYKLVENPDVGVFLVLGLSLVGKTTMIDTLRTGVHNPYIKPTLTFNIIELLMENYIFKTVDVSGQIRMRTEWWAYAKRPDAVIYVIDITDSPKRLEAAKKEFEKVMTHYAEGHEFQLSKKTPLLICLNKIDLLESTDQKYNEIRDLLEIERYQINYKAHLTSALTGEGLKEGFNWIITELLKIG